MNSIAARITAARKALSVKEGRQISMREMAAKVGVSAEGWRKWEDGRSEPDRSRMEQIAQALGVSLAWLELGEEQSARPVGQPIRPGVARILQLIDQFPDDQLPLVEQVIWGYLSLARASRKD